MFCGHCGSELQATDKFCGVCGEPNVEAAPAAPPAPAMKKPAPPKPAAPAPQPPAPATAGRTQRPPQPSEDRPAPPAKKKSLPDLPEPLPLKEKKKGSPVVLLVILLVVAAAVAASFLMISKQGSAPAPQAGPAKPNIKTFATTLCGLTKSNPVAIDDDSTYNYEFHALMSVNDDMLAQKGYSLNEYLEYAIDDIKNQMGQQVYEKATACTVKRAEELPCQGLYGDLSAALERHDVKYDVGALRKAGARQKLQTCGVIILEQSWAESSGQFPIVYFVGAAGSKYKILNYFYSDYYNPK